MRTYSPEQKPLNVEDYILWATSHLKLNFETADYYYNSVAKKMKEQFEKSPFWTTLVENIRVKEEQYLLNTKYDLLQGEFHPKIYIKEYTSFLEKCLRKNVIINESWPKPPEYGWIDHLNGYAKIGDIIRTQFIVKYLDGIDWIKEALMETCKKFECEFQYSYEARDDGYYAMHYDIVQIFEIPKMDWKTEKIVGRVEIQITTQLKDVIKKLIHKLYEEKRIRPSEGIEKWQWNYKSDEFVVNYLGHIVHYLEGTIMEIRDRR